MNRATAAAYTAHQSCAQCLPPNNISALPQEDAKGKGKEQRMDRKMTDSMNAAAESAPRSQSLSYYDTSDEPRLGQAERMEVVRMLSILFWQSDSVPVRTTLQIVLNATPSDSRT